MLVFGAGDVDYAGLPVVARRAYERTGFVETGDVVVTAIGADVVMTARLR